MDGCATGPIRYERGGRAGRARGQSGGSDHASAVGAGLGSRGRRRVGAAGDRVLSLHGAWTAVSNLGPTVGFLAALLVLADGCRRAGLFEALGAGMALGSRGRSSRLLAMVFLVAASTTAVLSLDATVVLLTPIVFATAARLRVNPRPHVYACSHLANSASLLLPVSNLTNLLAFHASGLSFARFAGVDRASLAGRGADRVAGAATDVRRRPAAAHGLLDPSPSARRLPWFALGVVALALVGFALSSLISVAPVWVAAAAALALVLRERPRPGEVVRAAEPTFLVFVLGLGNRRAGGQSARALERGRLAASPRHVASRACSAVASASAVVANVSNNLPATLIILPVAASSGPGAVLAMLVGVNVGPNLTYVGSLATLLWRRIVHAHDHETDMGEFTRLGLQTVPLALVASTVALWLALQVL